MGCAEQTLRVTLTFDVPSATQRVAPGTLAPILAALLAPPAYDSRPSAVPLADDRIERIGLGARCDAGRAPDLAAAHARFIAHGSLRVPASADRAFDAAVRYLRRDERMRHVIATVEHSHTSYTLRIVHDGADEFDPNASAIDWDPTSALRTTEGGRQSPALGLGHELAHAAERPSRYDAHCAARLRAYDDAEERRVIRGAEAHAARTLGEAQRFDHRGTLYRVASPVAS
jgi:hypothetical protein